MDKDTVDKELSAEEIASLYESEIENNDSVVENLSADDIINHFESQIDDEEEQLRKLHDHKVQFKSK